VTARTTFPTDAAAGGAPRVLVVAHGHPRLQPGGTEAVAHGLFRALKARGAPAFLLAGTDRAGDAGTPFRAVGDAPDELLFASDAFDLFRLGRRDLADFSGPFAQLLRAVRPDVVHLHHLLRVGAEAPALVRRILPDARIVLTLHDFHAICHADGQMTTPRELRPCRAAAPAACAACFPDRTAAEFLRRELHLKALLAHVDLFVAPSLFLRDRFVAWGLPADRIAVVRNGLPGAEPAPARALAEGERRAVFGIFGNVTPYKGATVALEALRRLADEGVRDARIEIHGTAGWRGTEFHEGFERAVEACGGRAAVHGPYAPDELPGRMAGVDWVLVPSVWWENAPLVVQEAFQHRRPPIVSGHGGLAEAVRDGVDGLHARPGDAADLARAMRRAVEAPDLHARLAAAAPAVRTLAEAADEHLSLYAALLGAQPARSAA
jgi:glycosyltransferase involved in cell wall biosynthesis